MFLDTRVKLAKLLEVGYELDTYIHEDDVAYIIADPTVMRYSLMNLGDKELVSKLKDSIWNTKLFWKVALEDTIKREPDYSPDRDIDFHAGESQSMWWDFGVIASTSIDEVVEWVWKEYMKDIKKS